MKRNTAIPTVEDAIKSAEEKLHLKDVEAQKITEERNALMQKINDLKILQKQTLLERYSVDAGKTIIMWAPHLDYHVTLISVFRIVEAVDQGDWGKSYKGVRTEYVTYDGETYCKSQFLHVSDTTLLHEIQRSETVVTSKETAVDELLMKLHNVCPSVNTYKEYQSLFTDIDTLWMPIEK